MTLIPMPEGMKMKRRPGLAPVVAALVLTSARLSAQASASICPPDQPHVVAELGIDAMHCPECSIHLGSPKGTVWTTFNSFPKLRAISLDGPAAKVLRTGDVLVAINGALVTTVDGARAYGEMKPGTPAKLTIRRDGRRMDVTLTPGSRCSSLRTIAPPPEAMRKA